MIRLAMKKHDFLSDRAEERKWSGKKVDLKENLPEGQEEKGDVRDLIGKDAGCSGKTVDKFLYIEKHDHELEGLEEDIKHFGCQCPITTWNGTIVDGHHRYEICTRHKLSFKTEEREFADEISVKRWIIDHQFSRRNLPIEERLRLAFEDTDLEALQEEAKERKLSNLEQFSNNVSERKPVYTRQEIFEKGRSLEKIAKEAGCSHVTAQSPRGMAPSLTATTDTRSARGILNKIFP